MINLNSYNKVLKVDKDSLQVTAQGGCLVRDLNNNILPSHGMAFSVMGTVSELTVAGVISTGTHGTGANIGTISSFVPEKLNSNVTSSDHFRFFWFPHTDDVACYQGNGTKEEPRVKGSWFWDILVGFYCVQILYLLSTYVSGPVPYINHFLFHTLYSSRVEKIDRSDKLFNFIFDFKHYVMEWAIPRKSTEGKTTTR